MNETANPSGAGDALWQEAAGVTARLQEERRHAGIAKRDLEPYRRGNIGIPYAFTFDSGQAGPHILVTCLAHGNEPGGLEAVVALLERGVQPLRGRLSLAICNVAAYEASNGIDPYGTRFVEEDFNRVWSDEKLDGEGRSVELERARELRPLLADADFLLDLHATPYEASPYFVLRPGTRAIVLAERIGVPHTRFFFNQGSAHAPTLSNYRQFSDPDSAAVGITLECGLFFAAESKQVALSAIARLLQLNGMISEADFLAIATWRDTRPRRDIVVEFPEITRTAQMRFLARPGDFQPFAKGEVAAFDGDRPVLAPFEGALVLWLKQNFEKDVQVFMWGRMDSAADGPPA